VRGLFLDPSTLHPTEDLPERTAVLLVPDADRGYLLRQVAGREAVVGPARPWDAVRDSYERALRAQALGLLGSTEEHLGALVLTADPAALEDLRAQVLAPLDDERSSSRDKLEETLRAWLLHQGRREEVAAALFVHPQTVRYRVGRLRDLYGDRLTDPSWVLGLTLALGLPHAHLRQKSE
jgi:DNA-binding PucR family transcriptional regulator